MKKIVSYFNLSLFLSFSFLLIACSSSVKELDLNDRQIICQRGPASTSKRCEERFSSLGANSQAVSIAVSTTVLKNRWKDYALKYAWDPIETPEYWSRLIGLSAVEDITDPSRHPLEVLGKGESLAWKKADRNLHDMTQGSFRLTREMILSFHKDISGLVKEQREWLMKQKPGLLSRLSGVFRRGSWRKRAMFDTFTLKSMSEEAFQASLANQEVLGIKVRELPGSKVGKRRALVSLISPGKIDKKINELVAWANAQMDLIRSGDSKSMDPIDLAAEFQFRFVGIMPFEDLSLRLSRLFMDRILYEFGLPPSTEFSHAFDYTLSLDQHKKRIRQGVMRTISRLEGKEFREKIPSIWNMGQGTNDRELLKNRQALRRLKPDSWHDILKFGENEKMFVFGQDGFFHDQFGVPYIMHEYSEDKFKLYPIPEEVYTLYGRAGRINGEEGVEREINPIHRQLIDRHVKVLKDIDTGSIAPKLVEIEPYQTIAKANKNSKLFFYDWQFPLLSWVSEIRENPVLNPMAALSPNRGDPIKRKAGGTSQFERIWFRGMEEMYLGDVIGQYQLRDLDFARLQDWVEKNLTGEQKEIVLGKIWKSRNVLHEAGRKLLRKFYTELENLSPEARRIAKQHPRYKGIELYLKYTKLGYKTYSEGLSVLGDDSIYLMRVQAAGRTRVLGFRSEVDQRVLAGMLLHKENRDWIIEVQNQIDRINEEMSQDEIQAKIDRGESLIDGRIANQIAKNATTDSRFNALLRSITRRILANPYRSRGSEEEFQRAFVEMYLHAVNNTPPKAGLSTTTNPSLLTRVRKDRKTGEYKLAFANGEFSGSIYIMRIPREHANVQYATTYDDQYEVYVQKPPKTIQSWFAIKHKLDLEDIIPPELANVPEPTKTEVERFLQEFFVLRRGVDF